MVKYKITRNETEFDEACILEQSPKIDPTTLFRATIAESD